MKRSRATDPVNCGVVLLASMVFLAGCGGGVDELARFPVTGTVTWNGAPLAEGEISFVAVDDGLTDVATIASGVYLLETTAGAKRVEIRSFRTDADPDADPATGTSVPSRTQIIPGQYNDQTSLKTEVSEDTENRADFELREDG